MIPLIPVDSIKYHDELYRPQADHQAISRKLSCLFNDTATSLVLGHLRRMGTGNPALGSSKQPVMAQIVSRVVRTLAVLYTTPPVRRLMVGGKALDDAEISAVAFASVMDECDYAAAWKRIDVLRALHRQLLVTFDEDVQSKTIQHGLHEPHAFFRAPALGARPVATVDSDDWVLIQVASDFQLEGKDQTVAERFYAWKNTGLGQWLCWLVDGAGAPMPINQQPYG